jgi:hypothetical protein
MDGPPNMNVHETRTPAEDAASLFCRDGFPVSRPAGVGHTPLSRKPSIHPKPQIFNAGYPRSRNHMTKLHSENMK